MKDKGEDEVDYGISDMVIDFNVTIQPATVLTYVVVVLIQIHERLGVFGRYKLECHEYSN